MADIQVLTFSDGSQLTLQEFEALSVAEQDALADQVAATSSVSDPSAGSSPAEESVPDGTGDGQVLTFTDGTEMTSQEFESLDEGEQDALADQLVSSTAASPPPGQSIAPKSEGEEAIAPNSTREETIAPKSPGDIGQAAEQPDPTGPVEVGTQGYTVDREFFENLTPVQQEFLKKNGVHLFNLREQDNAQRRDQFHLKIEDAGGLQKGFADGVLTVDDAVLAGFEREQAERFQARVLAQREIADLGGVQSAIASGQASEDLLLSAGYNQAQIEELDAQIAALPDDARDLLADEGLGAFRALVKNQKQARERLIELGGVHKALAFDAVSDQDLELAGFDPEDIEALRISIEALPSDLREVLATQGLQALNQAIATKKASTEGPESDANLAAQPVALVAPGVPDLGPRFDEHGKLLVEVADGFMLASDFQQLSASEQDFIRGQGVDAFNQQTARNLDRSDEIHEGDSLDSVDDQGRRLAPVGDGHMLADDFFNLSKSDQRLVREVGVEEFNETREEQVQIAATLARRGQLGQEDNLQQSVAAEQGTAEIQVARSEANIDQARARLTIELFRDPMHALANGIPIATFGLAGFDTDEIREAQRIINEDLTPGQRRLLEGHGYNRLESLLSLEFLEGVGDPPPTPEPTVEAVDGSVQAPVTFDGKTILLTLSPTPTPSRDPVPEDGSGRELPLGDQADAAAGVVASSLERSGEAAIMETESSIAIGSALAEDIKRVTGLVAVDVPKPIEDAGEAVGDFAASGLEATGESAMLEAQGLMAVGESMGDAGAAFGQDVAEKGAALGQDFGQLLVDVGVFLRDGKPAGEGVPTPELMPLPSFVEALVPLNDPSGDVGGYALVLTPTPDAPEAGQPGTPLNRRVLLVLEDGAESVIDVGNFILDTIAADEELYKNDPFKPTKLPTPPVPSPTPAPVSGDPTESGKAPLGPEALMPLMGAALVSPLPVIDETLVGILIAGLAAYTVIQNREGIAELVAEIPEALRDINLPGPSRPAVTPGTTTDFPIAPDLPNTTTFPGTAPDIPEATDFPGAAPQLPTITDSPGAPSAEVQRLMSSALEYVGAYTGTQEAIEDTGQLSPEAIRQIEQALRDGDEEFLRRWREQSLADTKAMAQRAREGSSFGQTTDATPEASAEESSDSVADFVARGFERQVEARAAAAAGAAEAFAAEPKAEDYVKKVRAAMENLAIKEAILAEARQSFVQSGGAAPQPSPEASTALAKAIGAAEAVLATGATAMQASSVVSEILAEVPQMPSNQPTPPAQAKGTPTSPAPAAASATPASPASSEAPVIADAVPSEEAGSVESSAPGIADAQTPTTVEQSVQTPAAIDQAATTPTATSAETPQAGASPSAQSVPVSSAAPIATPDALTSPLSELTNAPLANLSDITLATPAISPASALPASASASGVNELSNVQAQTQTPARATPAARTAAKAATLLDEDEKTRGKGRRRRRRKPGQDFPSRAAWKQGFGYRELDLDTGKSKFTLEPPPGVKIAEGPGSARKSFTVLEFDDDPPSQREIDMGAVLATVGEEIVYRPDRKNRRPKKGRRRGRRPRGRGRKPGSRRQVRF